MRMETTVKRINEAMLASRDAIGRARIMGQLSSELNRRMIEIRYGMGNAPGWAVERVYGYQQALTDMLYDRDLAFGVMVDGEFFSTRDDREDYYEKKGLSAIDFYSLSTKHKDKLGHYWTTTNPPKPYFIGD